MRDHSEETESREFVRYARILDATWDGESQEIDRSVAVWDISRGGVLLHVGEKFEIGAVLTIKIYNLKGETLVETIRVVRVEEQENGTWSLGGEFEAPLTQNQLKFLLY